MACVQFSSLYIVMNTFHRRQKKNRVSDKITHEATCSVHLSFLQDLLNVKNFRGGRKGDLA